MVCTRHLHRHSSIEDFRDRNLAQSLVRDVKSRLYDGDTNAAWTIHRVVRDLMSALSPVCPFFTHHISSTLYDVSAVDVREFPTRTPEDPNLRDLTSTIEEFNGNTWRTKKDAGLPLNAQISGIDIPNELSEFTAILTQMHKLE